MGERILLVGAEFGHGLSEAVGLKYRVIAEAARSSRRFDDAAAALAKARLDRARWRHEGDVTHEARAAAGDERLDQAQSAWRDAKAAEDCDYQPTFHPIVEFPPVTEQELRGGVAGAGSLFEHQLR